MKKELNLDYDISVDNMLNLTESDEFSGFKLETSEFGSMTKEEFTNMDVLQKTDEDFNRSQIMKMTDGKFILEVESDGGCEVDYFYSDDIKDLT